MQVVKLLKLLKLLTLKQLLKPAQQAHCIAIKYVRKFIEIIEIAGWSYSHVVCAVMSHGVHGEQHVDYIRQARKLHAMYICQNIE